MITAQDTALAATITREHAAVKLLEHGPLTLSQFRWITCWPTSDECLSVLNGLRKCNKIVQRNKHGSQVYEAVR
ncbi:MAG: hypothetical protein HYX42_04100 [Polaromonas sp.]|uniref:hypothetical protein n=1 Tax=Polaromonas sp. TaxID=1869339 RepID=UPI0025F45C25|nr:hypothetical protein [Polaromonas sp.]MBI2725413.1 hypothetical protein [Polaromonas sp.]